MKRTIIPLIAATLVLAGCEYEAPLSTQHTIPIDPSVLGHWEIVSDSGDAQDESERMLVLKYSDTEYLIHYPTGKGGMYFRGYPIRIGDVSCVQLQVIGTADGPPKADVTKLYQVVSYRLVNDKLEVKILNAELVSNESTNSESLRKAFLEHQSDEDLFNDPGTFRRIEPR